MKDCTTHNNVYKKLGIMVNKVIKIGCIILLLTSTSSAFGQQLLWSTVEKDSLKELKQYVPISDVTVEVMKFYDHYELYYDFTGFTKDAFLNSLPGGFSLDEKKKLDDIEELTVLAERTNLGQGSVVFVMCVGKNNLNAVVFSNTALISGMDFRLTYSSDSEREKFTRWFKTLLN